MAVASSPRCTEAYPGTAGDAILYLSNPRGIDQEVHTRHSLDTLQQLNAMSDRVVRRSRDCRTDPELRDGVPPAKSPAPELMDLASESKEVLDMYGVKENPKEASFARTRLRCGRLIERGVRFVQLFHEAWDQHGNLTADVKKNAPGYRSGECSGRLAILKHRGLLADTLVIWGGEFGCMPMVQGGNDGEATITTAASQCGWPVVVSRPDTCTA